MVELWVMVIMLSMGVGALICGLVSAQCAIERLEKFAADTIKTEKVRLQWDEQVGRDLEKLERRTR